MSRRWKEIKEDPARLSVYNDRGRQMKNEAEKPGDHSSVHEKMVAEGSAVKHPQKSPKNPEFVDTDSGTKDEQEPAVKHPQKALKTVEFVDTDPDDSGDEEEEPHPQKTSPGSVHRKPTKPAKELPATSHTPATSCTYVLTSGL